MPQKTIYVREEDQEIFEETEEMITKETLDADSLSSAIATSLRRYIREAKEKTRGMQKVQLRIGSKAKPINFRHIQFTGKMLAQHTTEEDEKKTSHQLYQSSKGKFLLYTSIYQSGELPEVATYKVFNSLEEITGTPPELTALAKSQLASGSVVFLDI